MSAKLRIGIICYPLVGGSGILASALGEELARRGHEIHFFSYKQPVRLDLTLPNVHFHAVTVSENKLFEYADYTLPLAVRVAEVAASVGLDIVHAHYAVPHATAAYLAKEMVGGAGFKIVTTLHGTDATLLGKDRNYRPAIEFALQRSDAVTAVSESLRQTSLKAFNVGQPIEVIHNFFNPGPVSVGRDAMREELGLGDEFALLHMSNLRPVKRIDLLLKAFSQCKSPAKLVLLAGESFEPYESLLDALKIRDRVIVTKAVSRVENLINACDAGLYASEEESFCLSILEMMFAAKPSAAFAVGGIPEVMDDCGLLAPFGDTAALATAIDRLAESKFREEMGARAELRAKERFSVEAILPKYVDLYERALRGE